MPGGKRTHNITTIYFYLYLPFSFLVRIFQQQLLVSGFSSACSWCWTQSPEQLCTVAKEGQLRTRGWSFAQGLAGLFLALLWTNMQSLVKSVEKLPLTSVSFGSNCKLATFDFTFLSCPQYFFFPVLTT